MHHGNYWGFGAYFNGVPDDGAESADTPPPPNRAAASQLVDVRWRGVVSFSVKYPSAVIPI
jgi:hypothetical protein